MVKAEILEQIFNRVVTKATAPVTHYLGTVDITVVYAGKYSSPFYFSPFVSYRSKLAILRLSKCKTIFKLPC